MKKTYITPATSTIRISMPRPIVASDSILNSDNELRIQGEDIERCDASYAASRFDDDWEDEF